MSIQVANVRLRRWQAAIVVLLFSGYAGYYFCRANISVATPLLIAEMHAHGISVEEATLRIGGLVSLGTLAYALGKLFLAGTGDFFGGKRNFLLGMLGAIAFTVVFALGGGLPIFTFAWIGNRLIQSIGWAGMVKVSSKWFSYSSYGTVMAILSLSYLVGDAVTRSAMGALIGIGFGWRTLFLLAATALGVLFLVNLLVLKESSSALDLPEPEVSPINVFGKSGSEDRPVDLRALLEPLLRNSSFWIVCILSFGTTLVRGTFDEWTPTYFISASGFSVAQAASYSALFPAAGAVSVLVAGWLSDRAGENGRARILFVGLALAACSLAALALLPKGSGMLAVLLVGAVAVFMIGPYSYLAGAMALDFGGRKGGAVSSGIIDGVGYLGGALSGVTVARVALSFGWSGAFFALAAVTALAAIAASILVGKRNRSMGLKYSELTR